MTVVLRYLRDFEVETIGLKKTPRHCSNVNCGARLRDTVLDWEVICQSFFALCIASEDSLFGR